MLPERLVEWLSGVKQVLLDTRVRRKKLLDPVLWGKSNIVHMAGVFRWFEEGVSQVLITGEIARS